jgi:hypothetical protein
MEVADGNEPERGIVGRPFPKGTSGNPGGMPKEVAEARRALMVHLPTAVKVFGELLQSTDQKTRLAAAAEVADRTMGKPKPMDIDTDAAVRATLSEVFAQLRAKLDPETYRMLVAQVAEASK